jgi:hypothetical protein
MKYMKYRFTKPTKIKKKPAKFVTFDLADEDAELDCGPNCDKSILSKIGPL